MTTKKCKKCGTPKPLDEFYKLKTGRDGYRPDCIPCNRATAKEHYTLKLTNEPPSAAAINGHIRFRNKPIEARINVDETKDLFKVYAHGKCLFEHYDKRKALNRANALGYFESSINFVMI